jgi:hypothetical protein
MQKIRVGLLMIVMCASSFFVSVVKGEEGSKINAPRTGIFQKADNIYNQIDFGKTAPLSREVFRKAYTGFLNLKGAGKLDRNQSLISICDFSLSANVKRLWVIDLDRSKVLFHSLVAHGQGTGEEYAERFSNQENSHQSSLGFYVTAETYEGDNGYSLKLKGMDIGYNDAAYNRAIVMHGANYVSDSYIRDNKRLGRSWGCPAVPVALSKPIINTIKNGTCLYIYYPSRNYLARSVWLNKVPKISDEELIRDEYLKMNKAGNPAIVAANTATAVPDSGKDKDPELPMYQGVKLAMPR